MQVLVPKDETLMGKVIQVEIVEATKFSMKGELVKDEPIATPAIIKKSKKAPVMETTFKSSIFYTLSMMMLMIACLVRLYHIFTVKMADQKPSNSNIPSSQQVHSMNM